jgi:hypothetical protein
MTLRGLLSRALGQRATLRTQAEVMRDEAQAMRDKADSMFKKIPREVSPRNVNGPLTNTQSYTAFFGAVKHYCAVRGVYATMVEGDSEPLVDLSLFKNIGEDTRLDLDTLLELTEEGRGADVEKVLQTTINLMPESKQSPWGQYSSAVTMSQYHTGATGMSGLAGTGGAGGSAGQAGYGQGMYSQSVVSAHQVQMIQQQQFAAAQQRQMGPINQQAMQQLAQAMNNTKNQLAANVFSNAFPQTRSNVSGGASPFGNILGSPYGVQPPPNTFLSKVKKVIGL